MAEIDHKSSLKCLDDILSFDEVGGNLSPDWYLKDQLHNSSYRDDMRLRSLTQCADDEADPVDFSCLGIEGSFDEVSMALRALTRLHLELEDHTRLDLNTCESNIGQLVKACQCLQSQIDEIVAKHSNSLFEDLTAMERLKKEIKNWKI